jgi:hypothetical protein
MHPFLDHHPLKRLRLSGGEPILMTEKTVKGLPFATDDVGRFPFTAQLTADSAVMDVA